MTSTIDITALRQSGQRFLDVAQATAGQPLVTPAAGQLEAGQLKAGQLKAGQWDADQIVAHVSLVNAATLTAVYAVTAGLRPSYDNRIAQDRWSIRRAFEAAGGREGLHRRIQHQVDSLAALAGSLSGPGELDATIPAVLVSGDTVLVDQALSIRDIITGLADVEWPTHGRQLLDVGLASGQSAPK